LRERLDTQPAAAKVKAQAMDDFDKALSGSKSAIDARQAGDSKVSQGRATRGPPFKALLRYPLDAVRGAADSLASGGP
jgi:hypothetical protein